MPSEELKQVMQRIAEVRARVGWGTDYFDVRASRAATPPTDMPLPDDASIEYRMVDQAPCYWVMCSGADPDRRIVYLHGGGFANGGFHTYRSLAGWLARATRAAVLFVEYRLAPEFRFPAGVDDAHAAVQFAADFGPGGRRRGADHLITAGDSAGAALAVATMLKARDRGTRMADAGVLLCGMMDLDETTSTFLQTTQRTRDLVRNYVTHLAHLRDPLASPILADLHGLPPLLIQTGTEDFCRDDSIRFAARAKEHGVVTTLEVWPEMVHIWQRYVPRVPEAMKAVDRIAEWILEVRPS